MNKQLDKKAKKKLLQISSCKKCNSQMIFIDCPFENLEEHLKKFIVEFNLKYEVAICPKCRSGGTYLY